MMISFVDQCRGGWVSPHLPSLRLFSPPVSSPRVEFVGRGEWPLRTLQPSSRHKSWINKFSKRPLSASAERSDALWWQGSGHHIEPREAGSPWGLASPVSIRRKSNFQGSCALQVKHKNSSCAVQVPVYNSLLNLWQYEEEKSFGFSSLNTWNP